MQHSIKGDNYKNESTRRYIFPRGFINYDCLEVLARNNIDRDSDFLQVNFLPDKRGEKKPEEILKLRGTIIGIDLLWKSESLESKIHTQNFRELCKTN